MRLLLMMPTYAVQLDLIPTLPSTISRYLCFQIRIWNRLMQSQYKIAMNSVNKMLYSALALLLVVAVAAKSSNLIVNAPGGHYRGTNEPGNLGVAYEAFYGIPYAEAPLRDLRFAVSVIICINFYINFSKWVKQIKTMFQNKCKYN